MNTQNGSLEATWSAILSRDEEKIKLAYLRLDESDRAVIIDHLEKMATEKGWHPEQVISAQKALLKMRKIHKS